MRRAGSKLVLHNKLAERFMARGGGFVSTKEEKNLSELGLVHLKSDLGKVTASEYITRCLVKEVGIVEKFLNSCNLPVLNFTFDGARVFKQQAGIFQTIATHARADRVPLSLILAPT